tara:strand:- start:108 stop:314 length:207 start_codon:yes stop_codon:yes gene_type:complete
MNTKQHQNRNFSNRAANPRKSIFQGATPVLFFTISFIAAGYFSSFDQHMKQCRKNNNSYNYCESIYRG